MSHAHLMHTRANAEAGHVTWIHKLKCAQTRMPPSDQICLRRPSTCCHLCHILLQIICQCEDRPHGSASAFISPLSFFDPLHLPVLDLMQVTKDYRLTSVSGPLTYNDITPSSEGRRDIWTDRQRGWDEAEAIDTGQNRPPPPTLPITHSDSNAASFCQMDSPINRSDTSDITSCFAEETMSSALPNVRPMKSFVSDDVTAG